MDACLSFNSIYVENCWVFDAAFQHPRTFKSSSALFIFTYLSIYLKQTQSSKSSSTKQLGLQTINFNYHNRKNDNRKIQLDRKKIRIWLKSEEYIQSQKRKSRSKH